MAEDDSDAFAAWIKVHPPPDLQQLAEQYGGLGRVPAHAWAAYDHAMAIWQEMYRKRHLE
jgi:hypothetical protein